MPAFDFSDLKPLQEDVTLPGGKHYVLKEASEDAFRDFRTVQSKGASLAEDKSVSIGTGVGDADSVLLQKCLFEVKDDGALGGVSLGFVRGLPRRITSQLVARVLQWLIDAEEQGDPKEPPKPTLGTFT